MSQLSPLWLAMSQFQHSRYPNPTWCLYNQAMSQLNTTRAVIKGGVKEQVIRTNGDEICLEDVKFWTTLDDHFSKKAMKEGIVSKTTILGTQKYQLLNLKENGKSKIMYQTEILDNFTFDYIEQTYGINVKSLILKKENKSV